MSQQQPSTAVADAANKWIAIGSIVSVAVFVIILHLVGLI